MQRGSDGDDPDWVVSVDSTSVRAHHHAAGAPKAAPIDVAAERLAVAFADAYRGVVEPADGVTRGQHRMTRICCLSRVVSGSGRRWDDPGAG